MHPAQSMSNLSCSTISSFEGDLYHDDHGCKEDHVQDESSFPMLYFEFQFGLSPEGQNDHTDDDHESSLGVRTSQYAAIPNLEQLQQSDQACCGSNSLTSNEEEQEEGEGGHSSFSSFWFSSHDGERCRPSHRRHSVQHWQQARKNITTNITKGMKTHELPEETRGKLRRLKASGVDSLELERGRSISSSPLYRRLSLPGKMTSIPSGENDSLVMSMTRLAKQKQKPQMQQKEEGVLGSTIATDEGDSHGSPQEEQTVPAP